MTTNHDQALEWVRWWVQGARHADPSWCLGAEGLPPELLAWIQGNPNAWLDQYLGMTTALPPPPDTALLQLLSLDAEQWSRVLNLVVTVCAGSESQLGAVLDPAGSVWCRRLGRALQPGLWLPAHWSAGSVDAKGLRLLRAWVGEPLWQRLRLRFNRLIIEDAERITFSDLPFSRLAAMWQAVAWYVSTTCIQGSRYVDALQPYPRPAEGVA